MRPAAGQGRGIVTPPATRGDDPRRSFDHPHDAPPPAVRDGAGKVDPEGFSSPPAFAGRTLVTLITGGGFGALAWADASGLGNLRAGWWLMPVALLVVGGGVEELCRLYESVGIRLPRMLLAGGGMLVLLASAAGPVDEVLDRLEAERKAGPEALASTKSSGRPPGLTEEERAVLLGLIVGKTPLQLDFGTALWSVPVVLDVVQKQFGKVLHSTTVLRTLHRMGLTPLQFTRQTENNLFRENYRKYRYLSFAYTYMGYNLKNPLFADKRVRQALAHAVNREEIIDGVLLGLGKPATGPYKPGTWAHNPNVRTYPHDPEKAKALLAEAGWRRTDGGFLEKDGKPFEFEIITNQGNEIRAKCAEIIQRRLAEIGIRVKIRVIEWAAFVNDFINKRKFDATILGWTIPMEPDLYDVWHSSKTGPQELNFVSFRNDEVDALIVRARETFDQPLRKRCYDRIQEILAEEQPYLFLYVPDALPILHARFRGVEVAPLGIGWNFIRWYVPKAEQKLVMTR